MAKKDHFSSDTHYGHAAEFAQKLHRQAEALSVVGAAFAALHREGGLDSDGIYFTLFAFSELMQHTADNVLIALDAVH